MSIFATMSQIDTRKIVEKKNGFTYLSWAHALRLLKQHVPDAMVTKHIFKQADDTYPVSYTHLTLPTIYSV